MCPFCVATALWIAAGVGATGGLSAFAVAKLRNNHVPERTQGEDHDHQ
jgi:hypothetical protein